MRRSILVLMLVSFVGLTSAVATSFNTTVENVSSFTTQVSLTIPCPVEPLPPRLWVRGPANANGTLDLAAPAVFDSPAPQGVVDRDDEDVDDQRRGAAYLMWHTPPAPECGYRMQGQVRLFIDQDADFNDRMSAGLFICPPTAPAHSDPDLTDCEIFDEEVAGNGPNDGDDDDFDQRVVNFGNVNELIPPGQELRLKVVNRTGFCFLLFCEVYSNEDWTLQWGYRSDRRAQLTIGVNPL